MKFSVSLEKLQEISPKCSNPSPMCASSLNYPTEPGGFKCNFDEFLRRFHTMRTASCSRTSASFSALVVYKSKLRSGCQSESDVFIYKVFFHSSSIAISIASSSSPVKTEREGGKKVYQIFLSSFTLNCLWVGFPARVGPLLISHRALSLSVMNPPPPFVQPPASLFSPLLTHFRLFSFSHFIHQHTTEFSFQLTFYFASTAFICIFVAVFPPELTLSACRPQLFITHLNLKA